MFAPKVAKAQTKGAESPGKLVSQRSTFAAQPFGSSGVEQAHMLQRMIGNQAPLRILAQRASNLTGNECCGNQEREVNPESTTVRPAPGSVSWDFSKISIFPPDSTNQSQARSPHSTPPLPGAIQAKLSVGPVSDPLEREADRVADQVMGKVMPARPVLQTNAGVSGIQRQEADQTTAADQMLADNNPLTAQIEQLLSQDGIQRNSAGGGDHGTDGIESLLSSTKGSGQPIPSPSRAEMEGAFGADFSGIRLHTNNRAVQMNRQLNSYAFTHGQDIYFNEGAFDPSTREGKHLLAHELTHTLQQSGSQIRRLSVTPNEFTPGDCGARRVRWIFSLDNPAPADGYIVQQVTALQTIEDCPSNVGSISLTPTIKFWEAWVVNAGDTHESLHSSFGYTDESSRPPEPTKSGMQASLGTIKFFPRSVTGDLGRDGVAPSTPGSPWGPGNAPPSQSLPSSLTQPAWWNATPTEGPARRWASSWWNCCGPEASHFSKIDASPKT
jgi:hypothetical protein